MCGTGHRRVQAAPPSLNTFASRKALPEPWRGLRDGALSAAVGVDGCVFVRTCLAGQARIGAWAGRWRARAGRQRARAGRWRAWLTRAVTLFALHRRVRVHWRGAHLRERPRPGPACAALLRDCTIVVRTEDTSGGKRPRAQGGGGGRAAGHALGLWRYQVVPLDSPRRPLCLSYASPMPALGSSYALSMLPMLLLCSFASPMLFLCSSHLSPTRISAPPMHLLCLSYAFP